ncbi:hypothetical protein F441_17147 [Phytophthora nicotianae CJ01A1]|uniref:Uncharacterized protein n=2 Tax=Phytophthora nicotianae TaxID=4792 RepID=W2I9Y4_PHYNI|nr:hypothetical protein L915_16801 [Phytophthora nicotianae]ETL30292.1 hypothetical protein L916_16711 [Phytophthora nicotianae]ETL83514.1 hypothetical protein L917_16536 [Phytophthora nicotianae]ETP06465.1 hypothetical protein F441_17147 [Phytophthora nicotianae CJ01A1]
MSLQDRVCTMFQRERFRNRYRITKVTTKMLYSVDFFSRPLDHFLSSEDPRAPPQDRTVVHDDGQWGGSEPHPNFLIRQADQLHHALYVIQEAASEWYPAAIAEVFRTVHGSAIQHVPYQSPTPVVNAWCNLYQAVFGRLFTDVLYGVDARDLVPRARRILSSESREYQQFVHRVLNDAMIRTVFAPQAPGPQVSDIRRTSDRPRDRQASRPRPGRSGRQADRTVIPQDIRNQIPVINGTQVCIRYQAMSGCSFPRCHHVHTLQRLPPPVLRWVTDRHGPLKGGHPQRA